MNIKIAPFYVCDDLEAYIKTLIFLKLNKEEFISRINHPNGGSIQNELDSLLIKDSNIHSSWKNRKQTYSIVINEPLHGICIGDNINEHNFTNEEEKITYKYLRVDNYKDLIQ